MADDQVIDPTGRTARFHDDQVDFVCFEDSGKEMPLGGCSEILSFAGLRVDVPPVEKAARGLEFTEV